jgi:radical SAM superfamily enzyme YgiQ (UPF0313 family)
MEIKKQIRFERVLFIIPDLQWENGYPSYPHPGIGYITELLEQHGIKCMVLDMTLGYKFAHLVKTINKYNPDLIGLSLYTYRYRRAYELISRIKGVTEKPIVIGGPHVSLWGKRCLEECAADLGIRYEGENPLLELCLNEPLNSIQNLIYRDNGQVKENTVRPFNTDLDALPFPKFSAFELTKYAEKSIGIISSRGCPFACTFCTVKTTMGRNFRARSPETVIEELKYWYDRGYRHFHVNDDTFNADIKRVYRICDLIEKENLVNVRFSAWQGMRLDKVDRIFLERLKSVGFYSLAFGVESYNNEILRSIKKGETTEQIDEGVKIACELGYFVMLFFIVGFPGETWEQVQNSLNFSLKYPVGAAAFFNTVPYPGTELFDSLQAEHLILADPAVYLNENVNTNNKRMLFESHAMTVEQRLKVRALGERFERKVSQKHLERQLSSLGISGKFLAWFICTRFARRSRLNLEHYGIPRKTRFVMMKFFKFNEASKKASV